MATKRQSAATLPAPNEAEQPKPSEPTLELMPKHDDNALSVEAALQALVSVDTKHIRAVKQGAKFTDRNGLEHEAKATLITVDSAKDIAEMDKVSGDAARARRDIASAELKKLESALTGATAASNAWVTRRVRVAQAAKSKLFTQTVTRQQINIRDEAEDLAAVHGKTAEYWRKVISEAAATEELVNS